MSITATAFPSSIQPMRRQNPGLTNLELEKKKLKFLEETIKNTWPNHPLFMSNAYEKYKTWVTEGGISSLTLLAQKACAEHRIRPDEEKLKGNESVQEYLKFGVLILDTSLLIQEFFSGAFVGLFPQNPSDNGDNLHFGIFKRGLSRVGSAGYWGDEIGYFSFSTGNPYLIGRGMRVEFSRNVKDKITVKRIGDTEYIPDYGSVITGKVVIEHYRADGKTIKQILKGTWGDQKNGIRGFVGEGVIEIYQEDGMTIKQIIKGTWGDRGDEDWDIIEEESSADKGYELEA